MKKNGVHAYAAYKHCEINLCAQGKCASVHTKHGEINLWAMGCHLHEFIAKKRAKIKSLPVCLVSPLNLLTENAFPYYKEALTS